jgi:hypothetical protein
MQMSSPPSTDLMWWILAKLTCECERLINQKGIKTKKKKKKISKSVVKLNSAVDSGLRYFA